MLKRAFVSTLFLLIAPLALASACGSSDSSDPPPPGSASVNSTGGVVEGAGVRLTIPEGAVQTGVTISIAAAAPAVAPPDSYVAVSPIYVFTPDGLVFQKPVTVEIPLPDALGSTDGIVWSSENAGVEDLPSSIRPGVMTASVMHFSRGFIGHAKHGEVSSDAGSDANSDGAVEDGPTTDGATCHPAGGSCDAGSQCCSGSCSVGMCSASTCKAQGSICVTGTECCSGVCGGSTTLHTCLVGSGMSP